MQHYDRDNFPLRYSIGHLLALVNQQKDRLLDKYLAPHDVTAAQFKVLLLQQKDAALDTPAALCRALSLDSGAMTRMLDRLENKGLLTRVRCDADRRQVRLLLTEQGNAFSQQIMSIAADALNDLTQPLTREEFKELDRLLRKVLTPTGLLPDDLGAH